jgi:hypothetical protein
MSDDPPTLWLTPGKSRYYDNQMNTGLTAIEETLFGTDPPAMMSPVIFRS